MQKNFRAEVVAAPPEAGLGYSIKIVDTDTGGFTYVKEVWDMNGPPRAWDDFRAARRAAEKMIAWAESR